MIKEIVNKNKDYIINMRREFHMYPEASFQEFRTSKRIQEELTSFGVPFKVVAGTGVVATIEGKNPGKTIVLRADMDALSVNEAPTVEYASKNPGMMHACGHDGHAAMLLGTAKTLSEVKDTFDGTIKLYFQPAEEVGKGALAMIAEEPLTNVDGCFGIHLWSDIPCGQVSVEAGPRMASADFFTITIEGKGGHGSLPHQAIDSVVVGAALIMNLQSVISRELSPLEANVLTVGSIHSGTRFNVIANQAVLEGTTRTFTVETRNKFEEIINRVIAGTCETYRAKGSMDYTYGPAPCINNEEHSKLAEKTVEKITGGKGLTKMEKITGAEDFCYFLNEVPGVLAFVGIKNDEKGCNFPHHHEKFNMDEDALEVGTALYAQYALDFLGQ